MDQRTRRSLLIAATVAVWATLGVTSMGRFKLAAKSGVTVNLATKPPAVRLTLDGERQFDGAYVETPLKLTLPPGRHRLKISREGFIAHLVTVEGDAGESFRMEDVVLQRNANAQFATVEVTAMGGDAPIHIEIDDGVARGEAPLTFGDLTAETAHRLTAYLHWPDKDPHYRCKFTAPGDDETVPYRISLKLRGTKIKAAGCERPKDKKAK